MKIERVGQILKRQGERLSKSHKVTRVVPQSVPDANRVIERLLIIKSYNTIQNEILKNYTNSYLSTFFSLLSLNEKNYHVKRNKLSFKTYKQFNNDYYNREEHLSTDNPVLSSEKIRYSVQSTEPNKDNVRKLILRTNHSKKESAHYRKSMVSNSNVNKKNVLKGLSAENIQLLQMINQTDNYLQSQRQHFKCQVMKRIMKVKEYIPVSTPVKCYAVNKRLSLKNRQKEKGNMTTTINDEFKHRKTISKFLSPMKMQL